MNAQAYRPHVWQAHNEAAMTHIAIVEAVNGSQVDWLEKVTDEHYPQM
jgi:quercetin dioxygenase-like cupin family protein